MTKHPLDAPLFYLTAPAACPYLPTRQERKVFTHLVGLGAPALNDILTQGGFRRSQNIAYRPACDGCRACVSVRIVVDEFDWTRGFRKVMRRNDDLVGAIKGAAPTSEQYGLFRRYLDARHADGGMADMSVLDFSMMIEDTHVDTMVIEYRRRGPDTGITGRGRGPALGVALTDLLADGLSMVYSFYDPDEDARGLGTFMILDHVRRAKERGLPYVYLGYWVEGARKMDYKRRFLPQQHLGPIGWGAPESE
ncbi:arginyltransferase [Siculibacillus lacustris]|uniref:Aspartate/glutamate leucyltransferase n=1 Tax=Siculibacillus lacustris TaxID=1549641 RepID=A0A4Q9VVB4_9HYPH|nr:arginyltransferase [Siculibacillus lacustris]TBW39737.1 arginyltransferase [Siculibacillus lacustris]